MANQKRVVSPLFKEEFTTRTPRRIVKPLFEEIQPVFKVTSGGGSELPKAYQELIENLTYIHGRFAQELSFEVTPTIVVNELESFYKEHELLKARDEKFQKIVAIIDKQTNLDSAVRIMKFGEVVQSDIGLLLTKISTLSSNMVQLKIVESVDSIIATIQELSMDKFLSKKSGFLFFSSSYTLEDYIKKYEESILKIEELIVGLKRIVASIDDLVRKSDALMAEQKRLVEQLEATNIAGKIIIERNSKKLFGEHNEVFLNEQFEKRLFDLTTYENVTILALEQSKLIQKNLINTAMNAMSVINSTYPLWRTSISTQITKWQTSSSGIKLSSPIKEIISDSSVKEASDKTEELLKLLISNSKG